MTAGFNGGGLGAENRPFSRKADELGPLVVGWFSLSARLGGRRGTETSWEMLADVNGARRGAVVGGE